MQGISPLRRRGGGFPIAPATPSVRSSSNLVVIQRWQVAAALSAAVTTTKQQETASTLQAEPAKEKAHPPSASRSSGEGVWGGGGEKGSGEEGKDSHSRQWRLSMAVFLNRNKRPEAAPIEVAELLSEKPPPPQNLPIVISSFLRSRFAFGCGGDGGCGDGLRFHGSGERGSSSCRPRDPCSD